MQLHASYSGEPGSSPTLVLMHFLGGSTREWDEVIALLGPKYRCLRLDLPGFGGSAGIPGYSVEEMANEVVHALCEHGVTRYILVGHSMSGKVAMVMARRSQDAHDATLVGLVLVAPSPPSPEPMGDEKRSMMLGLLGERHEDDLARARSYITKNEERDIPKAVEERAAKEVLKMNRTAWVAWLTHGSHEDWSRFVGILDLPALVIAGEKDRSLGPEQQRALTMPHLGDGRMVVVEGCSHLIPMERPERMATVIREFVLEIMSDTLKPVVPGEYLELIASERVSERTREVLEARMAGPTAVHGVLSEAQERTLRAVVTRLIPQERGSEIDIAGTMMERLASGKGDGWRYAVLPEDAQAYREGLDRLIEDGFCEMNPQAQDAALNCLHTIPGSADARWFEELRSDATVAYMAHPATLARIGYSGIGVGGAETATQGFVMLQPNEREAWEPEPTR